MDLKCGFFQGVMSNDLHIFERNILRHFGAKKENLTWGRRGNNELYCFFRKPDVLKMIMLGRLRCAGHVARMDADEIPKKLPDEDFAWDTT